MSVLIPTLKFLGEGLCESGNKDSHVCLLQTSVLIQVSLFPLSNDIFGEGILDIIFSFGDG